MSPPHIPVIMQRFNANDDVGTLVRWLRAPGQRVEQGDLVAEIETSKVSAEIEAPGTGFLVPLVDAGAKVAVGAAVAWISPEYNEAVQAQARATAAPPSQAERLISRDAERLLAQAGLTVADVPGAAPITSGVVEALLSAREVHAASLDRATQMMPPPNGVLLFGAAHQGLVVLDCLREEGKYQPICFVDERPKVPDLYGLPVFGVEAIEILARRGVRYAHVTIGSPKPKLRVAERLKSAGFEMVRAIHPHAFVSPSATLGEGVYIGPGVVIGPRAVIGNYTQVNNNATLPHDVIVGDAVRISDGANVAGGVRIGDRSLLGLGVTVNTDCHVGADATVMSGVSLFDSLPDGGSARSLVVRR